jgi:hypothetical protein
MYAHYSFNPRLAQAAAEDSRIILVRFPSLFDLLNTLIFPPDSIVDFSLARVYNTRRRSTLSLKKMFWLW